MLKNLILVESKKSLTLHFDFSCQETAGYQPTASASSYVPPPKQPPHPPPPHPPPSPPPPPPHPSAAATARSSSLLSQSSSSSVSLRPQQQQQQQLPAVETCHIGIPNFAVGAIIGAGGANIKRIIRDSNAFVTVGVIDLLSSATLSRQLRVSRYSLTQTQQQQQSHHYLKAK